MEEQSNNKAEIDIRTAYYIMKSRVFDSEKISDSFFLEWDGISDIDYNDILRVFHSYEFDKMEKKSKVQSDKNELKRYLLFKKISEMTPYFYIFFFLILIFTIAYGNSNSTTSWSIIILLYLIIINLPVYLRKKALKYRSISIR
ncbi:MAG: hypothetical protein JXR48_06865 [Candidatus Delongbacteria bacterium]|nr:hypothetical protein [Candidatus Delongbacteria bacterium]MBN2834672.1 hypothetical protein [Candidatus Delongbacteria bacterium]